MAKVASTLRQMSAARRQALLYNSRKRRRSLISVMHLLQTSDIERGVQEVTNTVFPVRTSPITFKTRVIVTGATSGVLFSAGSGTQAATAWLDGTTLGFVAGSGDTASERAIGTHSLALPVGRRTELSFAIRPGDGQIRVWDDRGLIICEQAPSGSFGTPNEWGTGGTVDFMAAASNANTAAGTTAAPVGLVADEELRVFNLQNPQHFQASCNYLIPDLPPVTGDSDLLFNATAIYFMAGFQTPALEGAP